MEKKTIILIVIAILVIVLAAFGLYIANNGSGNNSLGLNTSNILKLDNKTNDTAVNTTDDVDNLTNSTNGTVVGDNSPLNNTTNNTNATHKVYNPQTDSYVPVIGEKFDDEVHRWYTYDADGVRYYNTRIYTT